MFKSLYIRASCNALIRWCVMMVSCIVHLSELIDVSFSLRFLMGIMVMLQQYILEITCWMMLWVQFPVDLGGKNGFKLYLVLWWLDLSRLIKSSREKAYFYFPLPGDLSLNGLTKYKFWFYLFHVIYQDKHLEPLSQL